MKFVDEFRNSTVAMRYVSKIERICSRNWNIMEICGGQTHSIIRNGIDTLISNRVTLLHGPGCPVCITAAELVDQAVQIAANENVIFCTFGDMMRVPGSQSDLQSARASGADVRVVYSPLDSIDIACQNSHREIVFFAIGFETTAPAIAVALKQARLLNLANFSVLPAMALVPPAVEALLSSQLSRIDGFLAAGHVCTVMGYSEYEPIAYRYGVPIVVTGFEALDILQGIYLCISQLEEGSAKVLNQYSRAVTREGNLEAMKLMNEVFHVVDRRWRGLGAIPKSGLGLREEYRMFDAFNRFDLSTDECSNESQCISGLILQGLLKPEECAIFGTECTPDNALGASMVSSEGACAAYYRYRGRGVKVKAPEAGGKG